MFDNRPKDSVNKCLIETLEFDCCSVEIVLQLWKMKKIQMTNNILTEMAEVLERNEAVFQKQTLLIKERNIKRKRITTKCISIICMCININQRWPWICGKSLRLWRCHWTTDRSHSYSVIYRKERMAMKPNRDNRLIKLNLFF